jgi:REP element-mobilizing transposase RayT
MIELTLDATKNSVAAGVSPLYFLRMNPAPAVREKPHFAGEGTNRSFYLPRLPRESYQGDAVVHWTMPLAMRGTGWLDEMFHARFREIMLHATAREGLFCPIYCLMPDHVHLVWMGLRRDTNQRNGMKFLREHLGPLLRPHRFQHQAHDHVLQIEERKRGAFSKICFYILANPVRGRLIAESGMWPFCGAIVPGYPKAHPLQADFWPLFWKLYYTSRAPDAGNLKKS